VPTERSALNLQTTSSYTLPVSVYDEDHASSHTSDHEGTKLAPSWHQVSVQVSEQVKLLIHSIKDKELSVDEILEVYKTVYKLVYKSKWYFKKHTIQPAILEGYVEMVYPDSPNHPKQKYRLTAKGLQLKEIIKEQEKNNKAE